jgi:hypothetical protein
MIGKEQMVPMLLAACPSLREAWEASAAEWGGGPSPGVYIEFGDFVALFLEAYARGDSGCAQAVFDTVETFLSEGDSEIREYATIGFIEAVQNQASRKTFGAEAFLPFLKPRAQAAWKELDEFWQGMNSSKSEIKS